MPAVPGPAPFGDDVGASLGKYTTLLAEANPNQQVYAFEPNLNSLYYLGYRTAKYPNVTIVPAALTIDGKPMRATYDPNMHNPATGPQGITFSAAEAIARFGMPAFIKLDIEGLEKEFLEKCGELFRHTTMIVEWHPLSGIMSIRLCPIGVKPSRPPGTVRSAAGPGPAK